MIDDNKTSFVTTWDIDQILLPEPIPIFFNINSSPDPNVTASTATTTYAHNLGYLPVIEAQYQGGGMSTWHQCGLPDGFILANWDTSGFGGTPNFYPGMIPTNGIAVSYGFDTVNVYFNALNYSSLAQTISVRLYIWVDKINYD